MCLDNQMDMAMASPWALTTYPNTRKRRGLRERFDAAVPCSPRAQSDMRDLRILGCEHVIAVRVSQAASARAEFAPLLLRAGVP